MGYGINFRRYRGRLYVWAQGEPAGFVSIKPKRGQCSTFRAMAVVHTDGYGHPACEKIAECDSLRGAVGTLLATRSPNSQSF